MLMLSPPSFPQASVSLHLLIAANRKCLFFSPHLSYQHLWYGPFILCECLLPHYQTFPPSSMVRNFSHFSWNKVFAAFHKFSWNGENFNCENLTTTQATPFVCNTCGLQVLCVFLQWKCIVIRERGSILYLGMATEFEFTIVMYHPDNGQRSYKPQTKHAERMILLSSSQRHSRTYRWVRGSWETDRRKSRISSSSFFFFFFFLLLIQNSWLA